MKKTTEKKNVVVKKTTEKKENNRALLDVIKQRIIKANELLAVKIEYNFNVMFKNCVRENQVIDLCAMTDKTDEQCKMLLIKKTFYNKTDEMLALERITRHSIKDSAIDVIAKRQLKIADIRA